MNKERDLLPWILGGLTAATVAVAVTAISTHKPASASATVQSTALVASRPASSPVPIPLAAPPAAAPMPEPDAQTQPPVPVQAAALPEAQGGQIWECTTKGVKTFSNNPCGEKSTQLDVGPINTMSATPQIRYARGYAPEPRYTNAYTDQAPADFADNSDQYGSESDPNAYAIVRGLGFVPRRRPEHPHRVPNHHGPVPVRRY